MAEGRAGREAAERAAREIRTSVAAGQSVPMAFAIVRFAGYDAWRAARISANMGDDADTIRAIAVGLCEACQGAAALPADKVSLVQSVNDLDLAPLADVRAFLAAHRADGRPATSRRRHDSLACSDLRFAPQNLSRHSSVGGDAERREADAERRRHESRRVDPTNRLLRPYRDMLPADSGLDIQGASQEQRTERSAGFGRSVRFVAKRRGGGVCRLNRRCKGEQRPWTRF